MKFAVAWFDRAATAVAPESTEPLEADMNRVLAWRDRYGFRLLL
jgi:hypothetical protein